MYDESNEIKRELYEWAKKEIRVIFTGNVPANQVYRYMGAFDVLTHPTYREGFGKVLQEAMGMALPIITTNVPGPCEVVEENESGILVESHDTAGLEKEMQKLKENPQICSKLGEEARRQAEQYYERSKMLKNILTDLNELVGKGQK